MKSLGLLLVSTLFMPGADSSTRPVRDVVASNMDRSVDPGVDFFTYANGGWLKRHPIPPSDSAYGIGNVVNDDIYEQLRKIDEEAALKPSKAGSDLQKVGDFWVTAMDEGKAERLGLTPLKPQLDRIQAVASVADALDASFALDPLGVDTFFSFNVSQDEKKSDLMTLHLWQGGLGLPERDFYFNSDAGVVKIRAEYVKHLQNAFVILGDEPDAASNSATNVMAFETALAKTSRKLEDLRDPLSNYHKMTPQEVTAKLTPSIDWKGRFAALGLHPTSLVVGQPEFFGGLQTLLSNTPVETFRDYMRFHLLIRYEPYLNKQAQADDFHFVHQVLRGQKTPRARWKRVLDDENRAIGFVLGRIFVKNYFPPAAKRRYAALVEAIRTAYGERIDRLDWMDKATKAKAHQKLAAIVKKVGYPNKWKNYSTLAIGRGSYCENMMNAARWNFKDMLSKFGKPVDRTEWGMTPQTYNAYYDASNNEIVLPAAGFEIPGFKDSQVDDAVVYGYAAASTIGHEMTHGFDDEGRQYDAKGNLAEWWTKADAKRFEQRAEVMVKEFNAFEPLPGMHINGKASLGENIADYGGVLLGLDAFKKTEQYKHGKKIAGLSPLQRYFLGYALSWMSVYRPELLRSRLLSDVHAPPKWRVIGPLTNVPEFYKAFGIEPGQPMWRPADQRVHIW